MTGLSRCAPAVLLTGVLLGGLALTGCDDGDTAKAAAAAAKPCGSELSATAPTPLPSDVPAPGDFHAYSFTRAGATRVWLGTTAGDRGSLVRTRDTVAGLLRAAGYQVPKTDQEPGIEAEVEFSGTHAGSLQVQVACAGRLRLRYRLES